MDPLVELWDPPETKEAGLIAGWRQWADAGSVSSGLPEYIIEQTGAEKIGQINSDQFYIFQLPGTHHFLRPEIKFVDGYRRSLSSSKNEIYYANIGPNGLYIFLGDEPHLKPKRYAQAFFAAIEQLKINRVAALGGVYASSPYEKERDVACVYSLPAMREELADYAVRFSDYQGGATIGSYLLDRAEAREIEFLAFYAFVPAYDFSQLSNLLQGMRIESDYKAWYDLMRRFNHMFELGLDLSELLGQSNELIAAMDSKIEALAHKMPQANVIEYMEQVSEDFEEKTFLPLDDVWEQELGDIFDDME